MTILLTGSQGTIGSSLAGLLPGYGWALRTFDRLPGTGADHVRGELTDPAALDAALDGVSAAVHLAGQPTEAPWPVIRQANIDGTLALFEAARRAGVRRIVYASSNHAVGFTPRGTGELPADTPPRPDTLYGVSKAFGEALARYYCDRYDFEVACLRIGTFAERPPDLRSRSSWLAPADCAQLVDSCLRSTELGYALIWAISANRDRWWSLDAGTALGYRPTADAADYDGAGSDGAGSHGAVPLDLVGGMFTSPWFGIDEVAERYETERYETKHRDTEHRDTEHRDTEHRGGDS